MRYETTFIQARTRSTQSLNQKNYFLLVKLSALEIYSKSIAAFGHDSTQVPQSTHSSFLTTTFLFIVIAFQGHFFTHVPQSSHKPSSIITAIITTSLVIFNEVLKFLQFSCEFRFIFPDLIDVFHVGCHLMYADSEVVDCARNLILL